MKTKDRLLSQRTKTRLIPVLNVVKNGYYVFLMIRGV